MRTLIYFLVASCLLFSAQTVLAKTKILAIGDSMTAGYYDDADYHITTPGPTDPGGHIYYYSWRTPFDDLLSKFGYLDYEFVGPNQDGVLNEGNQTIIHGEETFSNLQVVARQELKHLSGNGYDADMIISKLDQAWFQDAPNDDIDIAIILIGANDILGSEPPTAVLDKIKTIVSKLRAKNRYIKILISQYPYSSLELGSNRNAEDGLMELNSLIYKYVEESNIGEIYTTAIDVGYNYKIDHWPQILDKGTPNERTAYVHPNNCGATKIAQAYFDMFNTMNIFGEEAQLSGLEESPEDQLPVFSASYYLKAHKELSDRFQGSSNKYGDALNHWLNQGRREGLASSPTFNPRHYLACNADVSFLKTGNKAYSSDPNDIQFEGVVDHYQDSGYDEPRTTSGNFIVDQYRTRYNDLYNMSRSQAADHFNRSGFNEGKVGKGAKYQIVAHHSGKCLDVQGVSTQDMAAIQQYECIGSQQRNQIWWIGAYEIDENRFISAGHTGKCLDIVGEGEGDGVAAQQYRCLGENQENQIWNFNHLGNDVYEIVNVKSRKCLDVRGGEGALHDGALVQQWSCLGTKNQQWELVPIDELVPND